MFTTTMLTTLRINEESAHEHRKRLRSFLKISVSKNHPVSIIFINFATKLRTDEKT